MMSYNYRISYLRINLKTLVLSVNLNSVILRQLKGDLSFCPKIGLKIVVNVL